MDSERNERVEGYIGRQIANYQHDPEFIADNWALEVAEATSRRLLELRRDAAWLAGAMGTSRWTVGRILAGWPNLTLLTLARLSAALDLSLEDLLNPQNTNNSAYPATPTDESRRGDPPVFP